MTDLFISYRRGDAAYALLLYDRLSAAFGRERVFRDVETIQPGEYFDETIVTELAKARGVVAVIGPGWLRARARLKSKDDWVRREIALALKKKRRLFPVLVGGARMPARAKLPRDAADLARADAVVLNDATFHRDVDPLLAALGRVVPRRAAAAAESGRALDARQTQAAALLRDQVDRLQVRAVELIQENKVDRALEELSAGYELVMVLMDWSPAEISLGVRLGYLYKTLGQAFDASGNRADAARYTDLAASIFERVRTDPGGDTVDRAALASAVNGIGNVYAQRGQIDRALEMYRSAVQLEPTYAYAWHDIFAALDQKARAGRIDLPAMREALDRVKETGFGQPGLSAAHVAELEAALAAWTQAAAAGRAPARRARASVPRRR